MNTLILSCNTGEGHNSCAKAIKEYYDSINEDCSVYDGLQFISPAVSNFMSWGHSYMYRHIPGLFKFGYGYSERHPAVFKKDSGIYRFMTQGSERMYNYILNGKYDSVICTHVFTALMLTDMLEKHPMDITTSFVATDYTCSPSTKESKLDYYFIPDEILKADFECENIPENKMIVSGIPVRQMLYKSCGKESAKGCMGINPKHKHLIMMCGSMGCGPMKILLRKIATQIPANWEISVICGNNKKLQENLLKQYTNNKRIHILGYVEDMGTILDSGDLYLTKPGGISTSEAVVKKLPMVLIDAVAGCEEYNKIHFIRKGFAKTGANISELTDICVALMTNDKKRLKLKNSFLENKDINSAYIIYTKMKNLEKGYHKTDTHTTSTGPLIAES